MLRVLRHPLDRTLRVLLSKPSTKRTRRIRRCSTATKCRARLPQKIRRDAGRVRDVEAVTKNTTIVVIWSCSPWPPDLRRRERPRRRLRSANREKRVAAEGVVLAFSLAPARQ